MTYFTHVFMELMARIVLAEREREEVTRTYTTVSEFVTGPNLNRSLFNATQTKIKK